MVPLDYFIGGEYLKQRFGLISGTGDKISCYSIQSRISLESSKSLRV